MAMRSAETMSLAAELKDDGITVICYCPGWCAAMILMDKPHSTLIILSVPQHPWQVHCCWPCLHQHWGCHLLISIMFDMLVWLHASQWAMVVLPA